MEKRVLAIILCMSIALGVVGCNSNNCDNSDEEHMIAAIDSGLNYKIFYDKDTKVMYFMLCNGGVTPMYNADGTLRLYNEDSNNE